MNSSVMERDKKLLSAYVDGELGSEQVKALERRLKDEPSLRDELELMRSVRQGVRDWCASLYVGAEGAQKSVDCWSGLERRIARDAEIAAAPKRSLFDLLYDTLGRWVASPVVGPAFAAVAIVGFLAVSPPTPHLDSQQVAQPLIDGASRSVQNVSLRSHGRVAPLVLPEPTLVNYRREMQRRATSAPRSLPFASIVDKGFVQGGLRSHGAEINWVRSPKSFELYPVEDREAPPVIWVANRPR